MTFKELSARVFEPASQWAMILGIIALLRPWSHLLPSYGMTIILVGLVGFTIFSHIKPPPRAEKE